VVRLDPRDRTAPASVSIDLLDAAGSTTRVCTFQAAIDPQLLSEAGVSYVARRGLKKDAAAPQPKLARDLITESPIDFEVLYDDRPIPLQVDDTTGETVIKTPEAGQKVSFRLRHLKKDSTTYGVVLRVNGKNTIYPGEADSGDLDARKWIVLPGKVMRIRGFQIDADTERTFKVAPITESQSGQVQYGPHAGTFSVAIFRAADAEPKQPAGGNEKKKPQQQPDQPADPVEEAVRRGQVVRQMESREAVQKELKTQAKDAAATSALVRRRSVPVVGEGEEGKAGVKEVAFVPYQHPEFFITIRYSKPSPK